MLDYISPLTRTHTTQSKYSYEIIAVALCASHRSRPYPVKYSGSLMPAEVARRRPWLVLGLKTAQECQRCFQRSQNKNLRRPIHDTQSHPLQKDVNSARANVLPLILVDTESLSGRHAQRQPHYVIIAVLGRMLRRFAACRRLFALA